MNEEDWALSPDPQAMLTHLRSVGGVTDRKYRLFACTCCRRIWDRFPDPRNRDLVVAVEDHPDGRFAEPWVSVAGLQAVADAASASSACEVECSGVPAYWVAKYLGRGFYKLSAEQSAAVVAAKAMSLNERDYGHRVESALYWSTPRDEVSARTISLPTPVPPSVAAEVAAQSVLLRDLFGPTPFRPVSFSPTWRTPTVTALATAMYESRCFDAAPILADALEEAGCDSGDILNHLRGDGVHVRGCWAVDLVLGRG